MNFFLLKSFFKNVKGTLKSLRKKIFMKYIGLRLVNLLNYTNMVTIHLKNLKFSLMKENESGTYSYIKKRIEVSKTNA